jgi:hypothetical protein
VAITLSTEFNSPKLIGRRKGDDIDQFGDATVSKTSRILSAAGRAGTAEQGPRACGGPTRAVSQGRLVAGPLEGRENRQPLPR